MNKLVIIGNGFDLAHGLKTRYSDFIVWYVNGFFKQLSGKKRHDDELLVGRNALQEPIEPIDEISEMKIRLDRHGNISISYKHKFFQILLNHAADFNWVDIESLYYRELKRIFLSLDNDPNSFDDNVKNLNLCIEIIKNKLEEYLTTIEKEDVSSKSIIENHFLDVFNFKDKTSRYSSLFLNFNYTSTLNKYTSLLTNGKYKTLHIHGRINDPDHPLIFGYGDEKDSTYAAIEELNNNEYLKNFKSFGYFKNSVYRNFSNFLESGYFKVFIMGHSCGMSDRVLLNSIFEHKNCSDIQIYYHNENDFFEKTLEMSRHFSNDNKGAMRKKIIPFSSSQPLS